MTDTPKDLPIEIKEPVAPQLPEAAPVEVPTPDAKSDDKPDPDQK